MNYGNAVIQWVYCQLRMNEFTVINETIKQDHTDKPLTYSKFTLITLANKLYDKLQTQRLRRKTAIHFSWLLRLKSLPSLREEINWKPHPLNYSIASLFLKSKFTLRNDNSSFQVGGEIRGRPTLLDGQ